MSLEEILRDFASTLKEAGTHFLRFFGACYLSPTSSYLRLRNEVESKYKCDEKNPILENKRIVSKGLSGLFLGTSLGLTLDYLIDTVITKRISGFENLSTFAGLSLISNGMSSIREFYRSRKEKKIMDEGTDQLKCERTIEPQRNYNKFGRKND